jgi:hypothetical protein
MFIMQRILYIAKNKQRLAGIIQCKNYNLVN